MKNNRHLVALVGSPNSGKTALFNALTGARQKVANYAGVTVERKEGIAITATGRQVRLLDLPGIYGLRARSEDEAISRDVITGAHARQDKPDAMILIADATRMETALRLAIELKQTELPAILVLNKSDVAESRGLKIDIAKLEAELGMPVIMAAAVKRQGIDAVLAALDTLVGSLEGAGAKAGCGGGCSGCAGGGCLMDIRTLCATRNKVNDILKASDHQPPRASEATKKLDQVLLHRLWGPFILLGLMFLVFQSVFAWAAIPMDMIDGATTWLVASVKDLLPQSMLRDLLTDGVMAGVGGVLIFLPQIVILYFFIILLEDSGYMARAAFLLDRLMGRVGLHGRSFIPLLSSFACAIPGIMASRVIENKRDRLIVIMIAPLMTCSARIPVYALVVSALIPSTKIWGVFNLQGLVFFALYISGILSGLVVAAVLRRTVLKGKPAALAMEMPNYQMPNIKDVLLGLYERAYIFLHRAGTVILSMSILVWVLSSWPQPPSGYTGQAIEYSLAGRIGHLLQPLFAPLGFDWTITASLIPTMAAREVFVSTLSTLYAVADTANAEASLASVLHGAWSLPVALSVLTWFIFAPQCVATIGAVRRETNSWGWTWACVGYLFALAWVMAFIVYRLALWVSGL